MDFKANRRPIVLLSVGLIVFTAAGVAVVVHLLIPEISWPIAFAIGAVVAPPDAVAATAIGRRIGLPRRIVTILEGESLFNDATALVALRTALGATAVGVSIAQVGWDFARAAGGGALVGFVLFAIVAWVRKRVDDPLLSTGMSLVVPFAAYVFAEQPFIEGSGVIAVVVAGLLLGHRAPIIQTAQSRIAERTNWRTIAYVLENAVFLLIGLQASWIVDDVAQSRIPPGRIAAVCIATLVAVVVLRLMWVFPTRYLLIRTRRRTPGSDTRPGPPASYAFIIGWAGMRGVVTLAAAFVIPEETENREVLLLIAFTVVAGTLFIQGLSLPWFARRLNVPSPDPADDALARATVLQQASKAGEEAIETLEYDDQHGVVDAIRTRVDQRNFAAWERLGTTAEKETPSELYSRIRLAMIGAERRRVLEIRDGGQVSSTVIAEVLTVLDVEESMLDLAAQERADLHSSGSLRQTGETCVELVEHPVGEIVENPVCAGCVAKGQGWVALRHCLDCDHVGCCDSSPDRHSTEHFRDTGHPVMQSAEPGEDWRWCFVHHLTD